MATVTTAMRLAPPQLRDELAQGGERSAGPLDQAQRRRDPPRHGRLHRLDHALLVLELALLRLARLQLGPQLVALAQRLGERLLGALRAGLGVEVGQVLGHRTHNSSAIRGASRLNTHMPSANSPTMIPAGISSRAAPPIAWAALGAVGSMTAWRTCSRIAASGLHMIRCWYFSFGTFSIA